MIERKLGRSAPSHPPASGPDSDVPSSDPVEPGRSGTAPAPGGTPYGRQAPVPDEETNKEKKKSKKKKKKGGIGSSRGIETMFRSSYRTNMDLSSLADTKANIMISINGIIISIIIASISPKIDANPWLLVPTSILLIACLGSIVCAVLSARPRVSRQELTLESVRRDNTNILFFGNFVSMQEPDFLVGMTELLQDTDRLYEVMLRDIYGLGLVLEKKFRFLRISYTIFMFGLVAGVVLFLIVYIWVIMAPTPGGGGIFP